MPYNYCLCTIPGMINTLTKFQKYFLHKAAWLLSLIIIESCQLETVHWCTYVNLSNIIIRHRFGYIAANMDKIIFKQQGVSKIPFNIFEHIKISNINFILVIFIFFFIFFEVISNCRVKLNYTLWFEITSGIIICIKLINQRFFDQFFFHFSINKSANLIVTQ